MEVKVVAEGEPEGATEVDLGPQSPLAMLRGKRAELDRALFKDLAVPRWEEKLEGRRLWVRYRPADPVLHSTRLTDREKKHQAALSKGAQGDPKWQTKAAADVLVAACDAIYMLGLDEEPPKGNLPPNEYMTFSSPEFSEILECGHSAVDTCMATYFTSGDLLLALAQLLEWSGQVSQEANKDFLSS